MDRKQSKIKDVKSIDKIEQMFYDKKNEHLFLWKEREIWKVQN